jgi:hypothetical protein
MLLARPKVFEEINDSTLNVCSKGDEGRKMHLQNISVNLQNYTACERTHSNMKNPLRKTWKRNFSFESFYYLVKIMCIMSLFSFKFYY